MRTENAKHEWIAEVDAKRNADLIAEADALRAERDRFEKEVGELRGRVEALESITRTTVRKAVSTVEAERDAALAQVAAMRGLVEAVPLCRGDECEGECGYGGYVGCAAIQNFLGERLPDDVHNLGRSWVSPEEHERQLRDVAKQVRAACADKAREIHATRGGIFDHQYMRENHADAIVRALDLTPIIDEAKGTK